MGKMVLALWQYNHKHVFSLQFITKSLYYELLGLLGRVKN